MKNLLLLTSIILFSVALQSCNSNKKGNTKEVVSTDTTATTVDTLATTGDTLTSISSSTSDTTSNKDDKYNTNTTDKHEAPEHLTPDQAKLDSIKNAKKKKKG